MGPGAEAGGAAGNGVDTATKGAFGFLVFMMVLNVLNILDRQLLPTFGPEIKADLGLTNGQFGLLTGIMFTLLYGLLSPFMGLVADAVHRPRFAAFGVGLWSLLTAASGLAKGFVSLAVPRVLIGVGESTLTPTALSMIAASVWPSSRMSSTRITRLPASSTCGRRSQCSVPPEVAPR